MQTVLSSRTPAFSVCPPAPSVRLCVRAASSGAGPGARADGGGPAKWAAPLLGWSGQPDYIDERLAPAPASASEEEVVVVEEEEEKEPRGPAAATRRGVLTDDKARRLRMQMMETGSYHDVMYHSAIASRLASAAPDER